MEIKIYQTNAVIQKGENSFTLDYDEQIGLFTRDEWKQEIKEKNTIDLTEKEIDEIINKLQYVQNNDSMFFEEDN